jgi:hypothetical protein
MTYIRPWKLPGVGFSSQELDSQFWTGFFITGATRQKGDAYAPPYY